MNIQSIAEAVVYKQHGWAVADQFVSTWENPTRSEFGACNENALEYIRKTIGGLLTSGILEEDAMDELEEYLEAMEQAIEYMNQEDEGPEYDSAGFTENDRIINGQYRNTSNS